MLILAYEKTKEKER